MSWFKVDDAFHSSKPVKKIPRKYRAAAIGLWVLAGTWSAQQKENGIIPEYMLDELSGTPALAGHLVDAGLWCKTEEGWRFVGWRKNQDGDYRRNISVGIRNEVMHRDGYKCVICGATTNLSLDHVQRYRDDGPDTAENLRVLCMPCNLERG